MSPLWADQLEKGNFLFICPKNQLEKGISLSVKIGKLPSLELIWTKWANLKKAAFPLVLGLVSPQKGSLVHCPICSTILGDLGMFTENKPLRNTLTRQLQAHSYWVELAQVKHNVGTTT